MHRAASRLFNPALASPVFLLALAVIFVPCLLAQKPSLSAHDFAQRVDAHYNHLHSLRAGFTESYTGLGVTRTESGTLLLLKPGRMKWEYNSPSGKIFLLDGKYGWFYSPGDPQVQRMPAAKLDDLRSPLRFLLGHTQLEKELTNIQLSSAPGGQFILTGMAKGQQQRIRRVSLTVASDGAINSIEVEETDGAITRFTFSDEKPNAAISDSTFHFTPPPGVPVIDSAPPV